MSNLSWGCAARGLGNWQPFSVALLLVALLAQAGSGQTSTATSTAARPRWTASRFMGGPDPPPPFVAERAFPQLKLVRPIFVIAEPGTSHYWVVEHGEGWHGPSRVYRFADNPDVSQKTLIYETPELIYSLEFHPNYVSNGQVFFFTNWRSRQEGRESEARNHLFRLTIERQSPYLLARQDPELMLEFWSSGHDGGGLAFGPDGMLYLSTGDGSSSSDQMNHGQTLDNLNAKVLRIDVDHPTDAAKYGIPSDNPFVDQPIVNGRPARPEVWAFGLRNPWRLTYDHRTEQLWAGNNGQDLWESVYLIRRGANYGWPIFEGNHPFQLHRDRSTVPISAATVDHSHAEARSLTGGVVYHGSRWPDLQSHYLYADFSTGKVWAVRHDGTQVVSHREIADTTLQITAFAHDHQGEVLMLDHEGAIYRLAQRAVSGQSTSFPRKLSESGLFVDTAEQRVDPGLIPYKINSPQWVDGANIQRWIGLPGDSRIEFTSRRAWKFPDLTVLAQTLSLEMQVGNAASRRRIETRILTRQEGEWVGYSYRWNDEQTDAELVPTEGLDVRLDPQGPGGNVQPQVWRFPSRTECTVCHNRAVDYVLGLSTVQMNRYVVAPWGDDVHQIEWMDKLGVFSNPPDQQGTWSSMPHPFDEEASLNERVRAYLHANCHHCHVHEGGGNAKINLEYAIRDPLAFWGAGGRRGRGGAGLASLPEHGTYHLTDPLLVNPRYPDRSVLYYRLSKLGRGRMPYAGSNVTDVEFLDLLWQWIEAGNLGEPKRQGAPDLPPDEAWFVPWRNAVREPHAPAMLPTPDDLTRLLSSTSGALLVQRMLDRAWGSEAWRAQVVQLAMENADENVRDLFERFLPLDQRRQRLGPQVRAADLLSIPGNADQGRELYFSGAGLQCRACHIAAGQGQGVVGPDLSDVGRRLTKGQILEAILEPSLKVEQRYQAQQITLHDGRMLTGVIEKTLSDHVLLRDAQNQSHRVPTEDIESMTPSAVSIMPTLQLQNLTAQEAADLLEFLSRLQGERQPN